MSWKMPRFLARTRRHTRDDIAVAEKERRPLSTFRYINIYITARPQV